MQHRSPLQDGRHQELMAVLGSIYDMRESRNIAFNMEEFLSTLDDLQFETALKRLSEHEPWQYIIGQSWFYGIELQVNRQVLIPRQETEELVHLILQNHPDRPPLKVLDIGTGSGCIPIALQFNRPHWKLKGIDISREALEVAQGNAKSCGLPVHWEQIDILHNIPQGGPWDIVVSNPPYISPEESGVMPDHVTRFEPGEALFAPADDPLLFYGRLADVGKQLLSPSGKIYLEINEFRADDTAKLFMNSGFRDVVIIRDLAGRDRMLTAGV